MCQDLQLTPALISPYSSPIEAKSLSKETKTHLKNVDQGSGQGAGRLKSGAYTAVREHFEPLRNTALGT
jgi:hypothetical protein